MAVGIKRYQDIVVEVAGVFSRQVMLRAYANRSMVLAMLFGAIAMGSLAFAVYVRLQPPTVIRVDGNGEATVAGR